MKRNRALTFFVFSFCALVSPQMAYADGGFTKKLADLLQNLVTSISPRPVSQEQKAQAVTKPTPTSPIPPKMATSSFDNPSKNTSSSPSGPLNGHSDALRSLRPSGQTRINLICWARSILGT